MFRAALLLIMRRINSAYTEIGMVMRYVDWLLAGSGWTWQKSVNITHDYTNCCIYRVDPPHDKQPCCLS